MMKKFHGPDPRVESLEESKNSKSKKKRGKMSEKNMKRKQVVTVSGYNCTWFKSSQFKT